MVDYPRRPVFAIAGLFLSAFMLLPAHADDLQRDVPIDRFHRVDDRLYRGAQPSEAGLRRLRDLGIKTIVDLRSEADAGRFDERRVVESLGMRYVHLPVKDGNVFTWSRRIPANTIAAFFRTLDSEPGPIFVHCRRGTDRTGAIVAFYRIARNGWERARAAKEAGDLGMRLWYRGLRQQIMSFTLPAVQTTPTAR